MGKNKYIKTPQKMWELFQDYKAYIKNDKTWEKVQYVGREGTRVSDAQKLPLTLEGFQNFVADIDGMPIGLDQYFTNQDDLYKDYMDICSHIKRQIREDQINGGLLGFYNPSITQRLNGLTEKVSTEVKGSLNIPNLPDIGDRK